MRAILLLSAALPLLASCMVRECPEPYGYAPVYPDPPPDVDPGPPTQAPGGERYCGVRGAEPCAEAEFCDFSPEAQCGAADHPGVCRPRPEVCTRDYRPVCGCDGRTYGNACSANASGMSVASQGECGGAHDPATQCVRGGCSGQLCVPRGEDAVSDCMYRPEYACYDAAACEMQPDGRCGWTATAELSQCLLRARAQ